LGFLLKVETCRLIDGLNEYRSSLFQSDAEILELLKNILRKSSFGLLSIGNFVAAYDMIKVDDTKVVPVMYYFDTKYAPYVYIPLREREMRWAIMMIGEVVYENYYLAKKYIVWMSVVTMISNIN
jgi:hypothetical protein